MLKQTFGLILLLTLVAGCGESGPATYPVSGTVMLDGKPVETATVTFIPDDMDNGKPAIGQTDAEGHYTLSSFHAPGAMAGAYRIQVTKYQTEQGGPSPYGDAPAEIDEDLSQEDQDAAYQNAYSAGAANRQKEMAAGARQSGPKNELPARYASVGTSDLQATVTPDGENSFDLELKSK